MRSATFGTRRLAAILAMLFIALGSASACEMAFKLVDESGVARRILPGSSIALEAGRTYTLRVEFFEDHRNCLYEPGDTLFLLDDAKWRVNKAEQGMVLAAGIAWVESGRNLNQADIAFAAAKPGGYSLRIVRECQKGGYDEVFAFIVK